MREPTPLYEAYAWHHATLTAEFPEDRPPVHEGEPQCGWFKVRLVKGGPWVPARIWIEQEIDPETDELLTDEVICCEVAGKSVDPQEWFPRLAVNPITEAEHDARKAHRDDVGWNDRTEDPYYNPRKPLDFNKLPFPEFDQK